MKKEAIAVRALSELGDLWKKFDVIGIDEGQFYADIVTFCEEVAGHGKIVITSALGGSSFREPFNSILDLLPKCEKIKQLHAICKICYHQASFTLRTTASQSLEMIGGQDMYMPVCRECFMFKTQEAEKRVSQVNDIQVIKFPGDNEDEDEKLLSITKSTTTHSSNSNGKDTTSNTNSSPSVQSDLTEDE